MNIFTEDFRFFVIIITILWNLKLTFGACPTKLHKLCTCEDRPIGFFIRCRQLGVDFNSLLSSLEKVRIGRLTVTDTSWPIIKQVSSLTIRSIHLVNCGIMNIDNEAFVPLADDIEELVLSNNSLTSIPVLGVLPKLRSLNLNHNQLNNIPDGPFDGLNNLRFLRLEGNQISEVSGSAMKNLKNTLELIDLSGNSLSQIPSEITANSPNLMYLDLSENKISSIAKTELSSTPNLKELRLNDNQLNSIESEALKGMTELQYLNLQRNSLFDVESIEFSEELPKLEVLDLSNNYLSKVPKFDYHQSLRQIKLDFNKLKQLEEGSFSGMPKLQLVSVQNNDISSVTNDSFKALDQLIILLLENNNIRKLEYGMLNGMPRLQQLSLRNNSLNELGNKTFTSVPELRMIDLSHNGLHRLPNDVFSPLFRVIWLDLSHNLLSTFEKGTFSHSIPNIILAGNPLRCDSNVNWFADYLVRYKVRTHLPSHSEVTCASPEKFVGVPLKDLLSKRAEDAFNAITKPLSSPTFGNQGSDFLRGLLPAGLSRLFPGFAPPAPPNPVADVPVIGAIAEAVPAIRNIPGLSLIPKVQGAGAIETRTLNNAIEEFSSPLIRIASGDPLILAEDIDQMVKAVPKLMVKAPSANKIDMSKLPPNVLSRALLGESIPGIMKQSLDENVKEQTLKIYEAAASASLAPQIKNSLTANAADVSLLKDIPEDLAKNIVNGAKLAFLTEEQMTVVRNYFTSKTNSFPADSVEKTAVIRNSFSVSPKILEIMRMLPANYDIRKVPQEIIQSVTRGEIPDLKLLPIELQRHIAANLDQLIMKFSRPGIRVEDVMEKLPKFARPEVTTFSPYNVVASDRSFSDNQNNKKLRTVHYVFILLGIASIGSIAILLTYCVRRKRRILNGSSFTKGSGQSSFTLSTPRPVVIRPSSNRQSPHLPAFYDSPSCNFPK